MLARLAFALKICRQLPWLVFRTPSFLSLLNRCVGDQLAALPPWKPGRAVTVPFFKLIYTEIATASLIATPHFPDTSCCHPTVATPFPGRL